MAAFVRGAAVLSIAACSSETATAPVDPGSVPVAVVELQPTVATLAAGETLQFLATVRDSDTSSYGLDRPVDWSTSDAGVARVSADGLVTAVASGSTTITASAEGKQASTPLHIVTGPLPAPASITVTPALDTLPAGSLLQLLAIVRDASGNVLEDRAVFWKSNVPNTATVYPDGRVRGRDPRAQTTETRRTKARITASSGGQTGLAEIFVTAYPGPADTINVITDNRGQPRG